MAEGQPMPEIGALVHFVYAFRPRFGRVTAHEARDTGSYLDLLGEARQMVQVSTADVDPPGVPTWNVPVASLGAVAPTLAELVEKYAENYSKARSVHGGGHHRRMVIEAREEMDRRWALARDDHPLMWDAHLNGTQSSASRERFRAIAAKKERERDRTWPMTNGS